MNPGLPPTQLASFNLLQLALPAKPVVNIGVFLLDPSTDRLYMKLREDWPEIAGPDDTVVLELLADDLAMKSAEMGGAALLKHLEDTLSNTLRVNGHLEVNISGFQK